MHRVKWTQSSSRRSNVYKEKCTKTIFTVVIFKLAFEKMFRQIRSMTSIFSTVVNFSMKEILHRLHRVHALNEITSDLGRFY